MDDGQRAMQVAVWLVCIVFGSIAFKGHMPTLEYGIDYFLSLTKWYGIVISWHLVYVFFVIWSFVAVLIIDFDKISDFDEKP